MRGLAEQGIDRPGFLSPHTFLQAGAGVSAPVRLDGGGAWLALAAAWAASIALPSPSIGPASFPARNALVRAGRLLAKAQMRQPQGS